MMNKSELDSQDIGKLIDICHSNLKNSNQCLKYLIKDRSIDKEFIKKYKIGYFPQNISLLKKYLSEETLIKSSIINYNNTSDFSSYFYLVFPIYSEYGEPIGISGRSLMNDEDRKALGIPKYKNSSYKKSNILYGLNLSKKDIISKQNVYITEGYFDHISMCKNGYTNSVAICGTAFSQGHFTKLARYTDMMTFILDSDEAGIKSAERIYLKFVNKGIKLRFLKPCPPYKDADEFFRENPNGDIHKSFEVIIPSGW